MIKIKQKLLLALFLLFVGSGIFPSSFIAASESGPDDDKKQSSALLGKKSQKKESLNGKVRSIRYVLAGFGEDSNNTTYIYDKNQNIAEKLVYDDTTLKSREVFKNGNPIELETYHELGYVVERTQKKFDKAGNLTNIKKFNTYKQLIHEENMKYDKLGNKTQHTVNGLPTKYSYSFDKNQNMVEIIEYDDDDVLVKMDIYWYNEDNNKTKWGRYNNSGINVYKVLYIYDHEGRISEQKSFNASNELEFQKSYVYDMNGNPIDIAEYDGTGNTQFRMSFEYIGEKLIKRTEFFADGSRTEYQFDEPNGNMTELCFFNSEGNPQHREKFEYNYDENNNWVRKTRSYNNTEEIIVRAVEYYP